MAKKLKPAVDVSTEEKIKEAARKVFIRKGYAATRTRDIAEEAEINHALLNYYFRSKAKLFEIVMAEKMQQFFGFLEPLLNDPETSIQTKITLIASNYIDLITENPDLPLFILSEIRSTPDHLLKTLGNTRVLVKSTLIRQIQEKIPGRSPLHYLFNIIGLCVFPFVMKPVLETVHDVDNKMFAQLMKERKQLIPLWIKAMLKEG